MPLEARDVIYCGACGMPPEYCEYGPDFESHCNPWLLKSHPDLHAKLKALRGAAAKPARGGEGQGDASKSAAPTRPWTAEERLTAFYTKYVPEKLDAIPALLEKYAGKEDKLFTALVTKYGPEPEDPYYANADDGDDDNDDDDLDGDMEGLDLKDNKKRRGVGAKQINKVDTRVVIQKISRNKKKAVTMVVGLETVPDVKLKEAAKIFSKRFAGSSSVKDGVHGKEIIIQGDHMDDVAEMIVSKFKVPASSVYLDLDGEFIPYQS